MGKKIDRAIKAIEKQLATQHFPADSDYAAGAKHALAQALAICKKARGTD